MPKIFKKTGEPFKKTGEIVPSEIVLTVSEDIEVQEMSDDQKLDLDKEYVDSLKEKEMSDALILTHNVLHLICPTFSSAWHIETAKDYPIITMSLIEKDNPTKIEKKFLAIGDYNYTTYVENGWSESFYTREGAISYMEKFYKIREEHLAILFPKP